MRQKSEHPLSSTEAANLCTELWECNEIEKLNPSGIARFEVFKFVEELNLSKAEIFDCVLAMTAKENNIDSIFTENIADFKHYKFIKAVNPFM